MKISVPPIKCQGIKTKLVSWIIDNIQETKYENWIEPFSGSGVVGFNVLPKKAVFSDINPHIINFYNSIKNDIITKSTAKEYLEKEGELLAKNGQDHYNNVRTRFNEEQNPFDFLFLNRSSFNGLIRFNKSGGFNTPFGHKPNRFRQAYITKIINQIDYVHKATKLYKWEFVNQDFRKAMMDIVNNDLVYFDPPYYGRHVDYFNSWTEKDETDLFNILVNLKCKFILSTWHSNKYRENELLKNFGDKFKIIKKEHFYFVGAKESNRNSMIEALVSNFNPTKNSVVKVDNNFVNLELFK